MLYITANKEAVDTALLTKDMAVREFALAYDIPLSEIAAIGDGIIDLPMLSIDGLGLIGAPGNANSRVKDLVNSRNGHVSDKKVLDAFFEFYGIAGNRGISHVISDKDGVLISEGDRSRGGEFAKLASVMGNGNPFVSVLTGSAYEQNSDFALAYGLTKDIDNPTVRKFPYLILAENGGVHVNILTGETHLPALNAYEVGVLKGRYEQAVKREVEKFMRSFNFKWSLDHNDQRGRVYCPDKRSMVTVNIPREYHNGKKFRDSEDATRFRSGVYAIMLETAQKLGMVYREL